MAKKQSFGTDAAAAKASKKRMAKVVVSTKTESGSYAFGEHMVEQDLVNDYIKAKKA